MNREETTATGGFSFCSLLAIVFITLKLLDKIDWSWWWVLAPLWVPISVLAIIVIVCVIASIIVGQFR